MDGTESTVDPLEGQASQDDNQETSIPKSQYDKAISDLKAEFGRKEKSLSLERDRYRSDVDQAKTSVSELEARLAELEEQRAKDDPEGLELAKTKRLLKSEQTKLTEAQRELDRKREEIEAEHQEITKWKLQREAERLEQQYGIKADKLLKYAKTPEDMQAMAEDFASSTPSVRPDSGRSVGAGISDDDFLKAYAAGKDSDHKRAQDIMKRIRG